MIGDILHNKKAQAAMEFLMTYGWATLIVLLALAALFAFGVFNPKTTNTCFVSAPFTCTDVKMDGTNLTLYLGANGIFTNGPSIDYTNVTLNGITASSGGGIISSNSVQPLTFVIIPNLNGGSKFSGIAIINYAQENKAPHTAVVQFSGIVEGGQSAITGEDTIAPTILINNNPSSPNLTDQVNVTADANDISGIAQIKIYVDNINIQTCLLTNKCSYTSNYSIGLHTYYATAVDASFNNNSASTSIQSFTVSSSNLSDTLPPNIIITSPLDNTTINGIVTVSAKASDDTGVTGVQFLLDGANLSNEITIAPYSIIWDTSTTSNGYHNLSARARDIVGNLNITTISIIVSNINLFSLILDMPFYPNYTDVKDYSGYDNNGTNKGAVWQNESQCGFKNGITNNSACYSFNGVNQYINITKPMITDTLSPQGGFTISLWYKISGFKPANCIFCGNSYPGFFQSGRKGVGFANTGANGMNITQAYIFTNVSMLTISSPVMVKDRWYHAVLILNNSDSDGISQMMYYHNGTFIGNRTVGNLTNYKLSIDSYLGISRENSGLTSFNGSIAQVKIYNRSLSASEVYGLYNS